MLFIYEKLDPALAALEALGATPWPEEDLMGDLEGGAGIEGGLPPELHQKRRRWRCRSAAGR